MDSSIRYQRSRDTLQVENQLSHNFVYWTESHKSSAEPNTMPREKHEKKKRQNFWNQNNAISPCLDKTQKKQQLRFVWFGQPQPIQFRDGSAQLPPTTRCFQYKPITIGNYNFSFTITINFSREIGSEKKEANVS